jgi:hypothetical protein
MAPACHAPKDTGARAVDEAESGDGVRIFADRFAIESTRRSRPWGPSKGRRHNRPSVQVGRAPALKRSRKPQDRQNRRNRASLATSGQLAEMSGKTTRDKGRPPPGGEEAEVVVYQPRGVELMHTQHKPSNDDYTHLNPESRKSLTRIKPVIFL